MRTKKPVNRKTWLIPKLRRLSLMWPPRNEAKKLARVSRGVYKCAICKALFKDKETRMDHINPVVDPNDGFQDLGKYVESLLPYEIGWQCLCLKCHEEKTIAENIIRDNVKKP